MLLKGLLRKTSRAVAVGVAARGGPLYEGGTGAFRHPVVLW